MRESELSYLTLSAYASDNDHVPGSNYRLLAERSFDELVLVVEDEWR